MPHRVAAYVGVALLALQATSAASDPIEEARSLLASGDPRAAVEKLETSLPEAAADQIPKFLELLRSAYPKAAEKAEAASQPREARHYREALELLGPSATEPPAEEPKPHPIPAAPSEEPPTHAAPQPPTEQAVDHLRLGDDLWKAKRFIEAGEHYAVLARDQRLPPSRKDHWAYCRLVVVLEKINAGPKTRNDWSEIHAEIDHIRALSPKNWYSEYLRNVVVERSGVPKKPARDPMVVRGAAPEEEAPRPARTRSQSAPKTKPASIPAPAPAAADIPTPVAPIGQPGPRQGNWQTFITPNFRVFHNDEALARKAAAKAEAARRDAAKRWTGIEPAGAWTPRCDLYLYPTAAIYAAQTQQPPESPGFSTAGLEGGRVVTRMVRLRADYEKLLDAALPHEVTHIVLADLFPAKQIPRWADEGMAVLSEPANEQELRLRDLSGPLNENVLFRLDVLMGADYPEGAHWALFYAQSVSLTKYLVEIGTAPQFVRFVRMSQHQGTNAALKTIYQIDNMAQLEARWKAKAHESLNPATAANDDGATTRR